MCSESKTQVKYIYMLFQNNEVDLLEIDKNVSTALKAVQKLHIIEKDPTNEGRASMVIILNNARLPRVPEAKKRACEEINGIFDMDLLVKDAAHFKKASCFVSKDMSDNYLYEIARSFPEHTQSYQTGITPLDNKNMPYIIKFDCMVDEISDRFLRIARNWENYIAVNNKFIDLSTKRGSV